MKIALLDGLPNLANSAEAEFLKRFQIACENLGGIEAKRVVTSDDIYEYDPDMVLVTYEESRKLTKYPTIGTIWSPLSFIEDDPHRVLGLKSYDGYLVGNKELKNYCKDLQFNRPIQKPVSEDYFLPTSYETDLLAIADVKDPTVCYMGVHWDGGRHAPLFDALAQRDFITFYGPEESWERHKDNYGGLIPFDGKSVPATIAKHGVALCLHKREHLRQNTPSMRIFEALSVGAILICDRVDFALKELKDVALFVDTTKSAKNVAQQIETHLEWIRNNRDEAVERAKRGKIWFNENWSLETKIKKCLLPTFEKVCAENQFNFTGRNYNKTPSITSKETQCEIVIRTGGRDLKMLKRAVDSVIDADSAEFPLGIIIVDYKKRDDVKKFVAEYVSKKLPVKYINSKDNGCRSTALWAGINAATAEFVSHLDDDDTVFPNHYRQLKSTLDKNDEAPMAFSGTVRVEESSGVFISAPNFLGPKNIIIEEKREICFFDDHDLSRLCHFDNYIQSNTWLARTKSIHSVIGEDPEFEVGEDVYLYLLLAQKGHFQFTNSATACWHWRSSEADNSMTSVSTRTWNRDGRRAVHRLQNLAYYYSPSLESAKILKPRQIHKFSVGTNVEEEANEIAVLNYGIKIDSGYFCEHLKFFDFFSTEKAGAWSKTELAKISFQIDDEVISDGGFLRLEIMTSVTSETSRKAKLYVDPAQAVYVEATTWEPRIVHVPLPKSLEEECTLMVGIDSLHYSSGRSLGVLIKSVEVVHKIMEKSAARNLPSPTSIKDIGAHYYSQGQYSHIEIYDRRHGHDRSYCLIQNNGSNYSIETKLSSIDASEKINRDYIENEFDPVIRVYFNDHKEDMTCRLNALPKKVIDAVKVVIDAENAPLLSDVATADRNATAAIFDIARKTLSPFFAKT